MSAPGDSELLRQMAAQETEIRELDDLRERMSHLLRATAEGLKGPPPPLTLHDWSDLPRLGAQARAVVDAAAWLVRTTSGDRVDKQAFARLVDELQLWALASARPARHQEQNR